MVMVVGIFAGLEADENRAGIVPGAAKKRDVGSTPKMKIKGKIGHGVAPGRFLREPNCMQREKAVDDQALDGAIEFRDPVTAERIGQERARAAQRGGNVIPLRQPGAGRGILEVVSGVGVVENRAERTLDGLAIVYRVIEARRRRKPAPQLLLLNPVVSGTGRSRSSRASGFSAPGK